MSEHNDGVHDGQFGGWRCLHALEEGAEHSCFCSLPPNEGEEESYELVGDRGLKNGEKKLRRLLQKSPEWRDEESRRQLAAELRAEKGDTALSKVLETKDPTALRKRHLFELCRRWGYVSSIWRAQRKSGKQASEQMAVDGNEQEPCSGLHGGSQLEQSQLEQPGSVVAPHTEQFPRKVQGPMRYKMELNGTAWWKPLLISSFNKVGAIDVPVEELERRALEWDDEGAIQFHEVMCQAWSQLERLSRTISMVYASFRREVRLHGLDRETSMRASKAPHLNQLRVRPTSVVTAVQPFLVTVFNSTLLSGQWRVREGCQEGIIVLQHMAHELQRAYEYSVTDFVAAVEEMMQAMQIYTSMLASSANDVIAIREKALSRRDDFLAERLRRISVNCSPDGNTPTYHPNLRPLS